MHRASKAKIFAGHGRSVFTMNVSQTWASLFVFEKILAAHKSLKWICEIGTGVGSLSVYLSTVAVIKHIPFLTIDIGDSQIPLAAKSLLSLHGTCLLRGDVFESSTKGIIKSFISEESGLLLCDGGDKKRELVEIGCVVGEGGIVLVHDVGNEWKLDKIKIPDNLELYEPWHTQSIGMKTSLAVFRTKQTVPM